MTTILIFHLKDSDLSWAPTNPDLTFCFKNSILVWVPCAFLWIFSLPDFYRIRKSRHSDIPLSFLNITKLISVILLILLSTMDLTFMILHRMNEEAEEEIYDVQFVSTGIKIVTFVSMRFSLLCQSLLLYNYIPFHRFMPQSFNSITKGLVNVLQFFCFSSG